MTFQDPGLDRAGATPDNIQDRVPPTERNQDPARAELTRELTTEGSRPLTRAEQDAAEHDVPRGERVYAPASERVPVDPMPGHRDFVEHTDPNTPERHRAEAAAEPSFTRVARPSGNPTADTPTPSPYASTMANPGYSSYSSSQSGDWRENKRRGLFLGVGLGWLVLSAAGAAGIWFYLRWRREQNRPINRIRRQAKQAAAELRERVPAGEDAVQPAVGLTAALLSTALVLWKQMRSEQPADNARKAAQTLSEADWQERLASLKQRWSPRRLELEKISISRH